MIRKVAEERHHTNEEVLGHLRNALEMVEMLEVADDLRVAAFTEAVRLLSAKQMWHEQVQPTMAIPGHKLHG